MRPTPTPTPPHPSVPQPSLLLGSAHGPGVRLPWDSQALCRGRTVPPPCSDTSPTARAALKAAPGSQMGLKGAQGEACSEHYGKPHFRAVICPSSWAPLTPMWHRPGTCTYGLAAPCSQPFPPPPACPLSVWPRVHCRVRWPGAGARATGEHMKEGCHRFVSTQEQGGLNTSPRNLAFFKNIS